LTFANLYVGNEYSLYINSLAHTLPEYEYNLSSLIAAIDAVSGFTFDVTGITVSDFNDYYVENTGTVREVLERICGDLGLGFYWQDGVIVLEDLRNGISLDEINNYVTGLGLTYQTNYVKRVSIEDNFNRLAHSFYRQAGGEQELSPSSYRIKVTYWPVELAAVGLNHYTNLDFTISVDNVTGILQPTTSLIGYQYVISEFDEMIGGQIMGSIAGLNPYFDAPNDWKMYNTTAKTDDFIAHLSPLIDNKKIYSITDNEQVFFTATEEKALEFFGRYYYTIGKAGDKGRKYRGSFYHSEATLKEVTEFAPYLNPTGANLTIGGAFGSTANSPGQLTENIRVCPGENINGVFIIENADYKPWIYYKTAGVPTFYKSLTELTTDITGLKSSVDKIQKNAIVERINTQISYENSYAIDENCLILNKTGTDIALGWQESDTLLNQYVANMWFAAYATREKKEWAELQIDNGLATWSTQQVFNIDSTVTEPCLRIEMDSREITPEDVAGYLPSLLNPNSLPLAAICNNAADLTTRVNGVATEKYGLLTFDKVNPSATINVNVADFGIEADDNFYKYCNGINYLLKTDGPEISYSFSTRERKIPAPDVFSQKYGLRITQKISNIAGNSFYSKSSYSGSC
jgi:hypothetical protein